MKTMAYDIGLLSLKTLIGPVSRATEALARLDERLTRSPAPMSVLLPDFN